MFGITDLYSKKNRPQPTAIDYGPLPEGLKIQLNFIFNDFFNSALDYYGSPIGDEVWELLDNTLKREHMLISLRTGLSGNSNIKVCAYFLNLKRIEEELDVIHLAGRCIEACIENNYQCPYSPQQALSDINTRLQEHGMGYRFQDGNIIKVPAEFNYKQSIEPSLILLHQAGFENAHQEFLSAFEHYKKGVGEYEQALECVWDLCWA